MHGQLTCCCFCSLSSSLLPELMLTNVPALPALAGAALPAALPAAELAPPPLLLPAPAVVGALLVVAGLPSNRLPWPTKAWNLGSSGSASSSAGFSSAQ